jgi:hypothetical protein
LSIKHTSHLELITDKRRNDREGSAGRRKGDKQQEEGRKISSKKKEGR